MTTMTIPQALRAAADHIEKVGLHKGHLFDPMVMNRKAAPACGYGAIAAVMGLEYAPLSTFAQPTAEPSLRQALADFNEARLAVDTTISATTYHSSMPHFNDSQRTRAEDVCKMLRLAAEEYESGKSRERMALRREARGWSDYYSTPAAEAMLPGQTSATVTYQYAKPSQSFAANYAKVAAESKTTLAAMQAMLDTWISGTLVFTDDQEPAAAVEWTEAKIKSFDITTVEGEAKTYTLDQWAAGADKTYESLTAAAAPAKVYDGSKATVDDPSVTEVEVIEAAEALVTALATDTWDELIAQQAPEVQTTSTAQAVAA